MSLETRNYNFREINGVALTASYTVLSLVSSLATHIFPLFVVLDLILGSTYVVTLLFNWYHPWLLVYFHSPLSSDSRLLDTGRFPWLLIKHSLVPLPLIFSLPTLSSAPFIVINLILVCFSIIILSLSFIPLLQLITPWDFLCVPQSWGMTIFIVPRLLPDFPHYWPCPIIDNVVTGLASYQLTLALPLPFFHWHLLIPFFTSVISSTL